MRRLVAFVVLVMLALPSLALARRLASTREHAKIAAMVGFRSAKIPLHCTKAYVSTANRTWASIEPIHTGSCASAPLGDGLVIVHIEHHHWRAVTAGRAFSCPIVSYQGQPTVPAQVAADLVRYVHCA